MAETFRLSLAQLNPSVGAVAANAEKARAAWQVACEAGSDMVALTEMFITGYQTQDLILKPAFHNAAIAAIKALAQDCADGPALGIGGPALVEGRLYNAYYICQGGRITATVLKHHLPNDAVFDEKRIFTPADVHGPYTVGPVRIGTPICEDAWHADVAETLMETGAEILLVPNGSPYHRGKPNLRLNLMVSRVIETGLPLVYLNMVGGQDDQVFDGSSMVLNPGGQLAVQMPQFDENITHVTFRREAEGWRADPGEIAPIPPIGEADYRACAVTVRLHGEMRVQEGGAGPVGGDRFGDCGGDCIGCHRPAECALCDVAIGIYQCAFAGGCERLCPRAGLPAGYLADHGSAKGGGRHFGPAF